MTDFDLDELVKSARDVDQPSASHADRLFESVINGPPAPGAIDPTSGATQTGTITSAASHVTLAVGALIGLGGAAGIVALNLSEQEATEAPVRAQEPNSVNEQPANKDPAKTSAFQDTEERSRNAASPEQITAEKMASSPAPQPKKNRPSSAKDSLAEEVALVRKAKLAFNQKNHQEALKHLDRYRAKFPRGTLRAEAHSTRVLVLCAMGRTDEALNSAKHLSANSPLKEKLKKGCTARQ